MKIDTKELFLKQYKNNTLMRYDIIVRCIAVDNFLKNKKFHPIYKKDIKKRVKYVTSKPDTITPIKESINRFTNHISNFMIHKKYLPEFPIELYDDFMIKDGIHRIAICLSLKIPVMYYTLEGNNPIQDYQNYQYYKKIFRKKELLMLIEKERELLNE